jgi:hypothetical protein
MLVPVVLVTDVPDPQLVPALNVPFTPTPLPATVPEMVTLTPALIESAVDTALPSELCVP